MTLYGNVELSKDLEDFLRTNETRRFRQFIIKKLPTRDLEGLFKVFACDDFEDMERTMMDKYVVDAFLENRKLSHLKGYVQAESLFRLCSEVDRPDFGSAILGNNFDEFDAQLLKRAVEDLYKKRRER